MAKYDITHTCGHQVTHNLGGREKDRAGKAALARMQINTRQHEGKAMTRYALIDKHSGYVFGVVEAKDPLAAVRAVDAEDGDGPYDYEEHGPQARVAGDGYYVYEAPAGYDCEDGQDDGVIATVSAMPLRAYVERRKTWGDA